MWSLVRSIERMAQLTLGFSYWFLGVLRSKQAITSKIPDPSTHGKNSGSYVPQTDTSLTHHSVMLLVVGQVEPA